MTELHPPHQRPFGAVIEAAPDVDRLIADLLDDGTEAVELVAGAGHLVGLYLGTLPRHSIRDAFRKASIAVEALAAPIALDVEQPDEGVVADVDDYLNLAADLGARRLKLAAGTPGGLAGLEESGNVVAADRVSQRLAAVLARAGELGVLIAAGNSGQAAGAEELAAILAAAEALPTGAEGAHTAPAGPDDTAVLGAAWNVRTSTAAGEALDISAKLLKPYLDGGRGYVLCETAAAATALLEAVPEAAQWQVLIEGADEPAGVDG